MRDNNAQESLRTAVQDECACRPPPKLVKASRDARQARRVYVVIDGTLIAIDRVAAGRPYYSGKHKRHGMNLQVTDHPVTKRLRPR
jgi:hypothetical protein